MSKRALCLVAAVVAVGVALASPGLTANTRVPRNGKAARKILRADIAKIAHAYSHKRYRAVCSDLTKRERKHLGGMSSCTHKIALINAVVPIEKFTITGTRLAQRRMQATVSLYVNGDKKHLVHAVAQWEGGAYRLDHESGW